MSQTATPKPKLADLQKLLRNLPKITLDPNHHEVSQIPDTAKVWLIDSKFMASLKSFAEFNARTHKLVNYKKATIGLTRIIRI
jgi:hypothetical protein